MCALDSQYVCTTIMDTSVTVNINLDDTAPSVYSQSHSSARMSGYLDSTPHMQGLHFADIKTFFF